MKRFPFWTVFITLAVAVAGVAQTQVSREKMGKLLRYPDIHGDKVVFVYGGDLWLASIHDGLARRLTTHVGQELFPKFSPDGKWIAFTGEYDGNMDVYLIPAEGGIPRRLTYHPGADLVVDWYPDGKHVLFRSSRKSFSRRFNRLFKVSLNGGLPEVLPLPTGELASFSPDGKQLAYNRMSREFRTWKRYRGGMAQDIWLYDFEKNSVRRLTTFPGTDNFPMWHGDKIYFTSDRDYTMNIFEYDLKTGKVQQVTHFSEYDVKWPSLGPESIVFENGGVLYRLDLQTFKTEALRIENPGDRVLTRPGIRNVSRFIQNWGISPSGMRAVFEARGDIFTVPRKYGDVRNLTRTPGIREIRPAWSPDGRWIAYLSDATGEYELYIRPQDGTGEARQLTRGRKTYYFQPVWSPDSKKIAISDKTHSLFFVGLKDGKLHKVDHSVRADIRDYDWSPDSRWLAYVKTEHNYFGSVFLYSLDQKKVYRVTDSFTDEGSVAFDPEGKYLYFTSERHFNPMFSNFEQSFVYNVTTGIYVTTLRKDEPSPLKPLSDEEKPKEEKETGPKEKSGQKEKKPGSRPLQIDVAGIGDRVVEVPVGPGNFAALQAVKRKIIFLSYQKHPVGQGGPFSGDLYYYDFKKREKKKIIGGIQSAEVSADGKKLLYSAKNGQLFGIVDVQAGQKVGKGKLKTDRLEMWVDPQAEWRQMFHEAWRLERDFYYDPNMHGLDWKKVGAKYEKLLPYVAHRSDLNYLIGEMIAELNTSHTYVGGGDFPKVKREDVGLLGADLRPDPGGYYRFERIFTEKDWSSHQRTPLHEPGVEVKPGEFLIAVQGHEVHMNENPFKYFIGTVGKQIRILVNSVPSRKGARELTVVPIRSDAGLRYQAWVEANRRKVEAATGGKVAYVHVPNTSLQGLNDFIKGFYPQAQKQAIIVDERYNSGGYIPWMFVEVLRRRTLSLWARRHAEPFRSPAMAIDGPKVMIINHYAGSGGDAFPYYFKELKLGTVVGTRTWGGLVGISRNIPLMDGGRVTMPDFGMYNLKGQWAVENYGVDPDVKVDDRPDLVVAGHDPSLEKAIEIIKQELKKHPPVLPKPPKYPVEKRK